MMLCDSAETHDGKPVRAACFCPHDHLTVLVLEDGTVVELRSRLRGIADRSRVLRRLAAMARR
jgi:hypothetical protein